MILIFNKKKVSKHVIDDEGYRLNVGFVITNDQQQVFWGKRAAKSNGWQFPQGGIKEDETELDAMYRELREEVGLGPNDIDVVAKSKQWLSYELPEQFRRYDSQPLCVGQKQRWFLLKLVVPDTAFRLDLARRPEFVEWRWVDYWYAVDNIIDFKRDVYMKALTEFEQYIFQDK